MRRKRLVNRSALIKALSSRSYEEVGGDIGGWVADDLILAAA